ncbi:MAG: GspMb/PilO family protein [Acidobacteriota bacterium]
MRALYGGGPVPLGRILAEHRRTLVPLAVVLVVGAGLLAFVVMPMRASVTLAERRASQADAALAAAEGEVKAAEGTRAGKERAAADLQKFYADVLPADVAAARRITHLKLAQLAREHGVRYERMSAIPESIRGSALERLRVTFMLSGDYEDIRSFIYDLETAPEFVVIDNMVLSEGGTQQAPLTLDLQVSTYYRARPDGR